MNGLYMGELKTMVPESPIQTPDNLSEMTNEIIVTEEELNNNIVFEYSDDNIDDSIII